jgi:hypothetical protein
MNALKILTDKNLTISQVFNVVDYWYGSYRGKGIGVIQSTAGFDLEEIVQDTDIPFWYDGNVIEEYKLSEEEVLTLVLFWYDEIYLNEEQSEMYNLQFGLIETELTRKDINLLFGQKILESCDEVFYSDDENIELCDYILLEFKKLDEMKETANALKNFNPLNNLN